MSAAKDFQTAVESGEQHSEASMQALFDSLPGVSPDGLWGDWEGGLLATGHAGESQLDAVGWVGKCFNSREDVQPIIVRGENGERQPSDMMGQARLRAVEYRGVVSAAMIYDKHPTIDYFRAVDADTLMGVMDHKGDTASLYFFLRRLPA